ncbi:MAG: hypothetical protein JW781_06765 [Deltaproteobacteria bacterium]|nr:hypothetical protein [Candidatus Anaeroferrophillacea bacterium]
MILPVSIISRAVWRQAVGERLLQAVFAGALLLLGLAAFAAPLDIGEAGKLYYDAGFALLSFFLLLVTMLFGWRWSPARRRGPEACWLLTRPVSRAEVLLGLYGGVALTAVVCTAILSLVFFGLYVAVGHPWSAMMAVAVLLLLEKYLLFLALMFFIGTWAEGFAAAFIALALLVVGHGTGLLRLAAEGPGGVGAAVAGFFYHLLPDFSLFNISSAAFHGEGGDSRQLAGRCAYGVVAIVLLLALACRRFRRLEMD